MNNKRFLKRQYLVTIPRYGNFLDYNNPIPIPNVKNILWCVLKTINFPSVSFIIENTLVVRRNRPKLN